MSQISNEQLAKVLLEGGFLRQDVLEKALERVEKTHLSLEQVILEQELILDEQLGQLVASELGVPFVDLENSLIDPDTIQILPEAFAVEHSVVIFRNDGAEYFVAMQNPHDAHLLDILRKRLGPNLKLHYATKRDLKQAFHIYKQGLDERIRVLVDQAMGRNTEATDLDEVEKDTEVIQISNLLFEFAYTQKASDLHIEPQEHQTVVRFRMDGVLNDMIFLPKELHNRLITRLKILAHLRTDEHYSAQDGHVEYIFSGEKVDMRMSILPTTYGEKVVLRLLSEKSRQYSLEELGFVEEDLKTLKEEAQKPWGMILVTGPTGAGKTTTLYAVLKLLNRREVNISTIEDPVEYSIGGVNQIQVNPKTDLTFANGLRSIVRQDPDIVMVGEVRDSETADIAVNAALTGHLLLSTLHTNDAATALPRLLDMGVEPFLVASTVNVVLAQRLVRKNCPKCVHSYEVTLEDLEAQDLVISDKIKEALFVDGVAQLYKGESCEMCHNGYHGRMGVYEILQVDAKIREMIMAEKSADEIKGYAVEQGMSTMFDDTLEKVKQGQTTLEELLRVIRE